MLSNMIVKLCLVFFILLSLTSCKCSDEKSALTFYDSGEEFDSQSEDAKSSSDYDFMSDSEIVSIPFVENGGLKFINVSVNGIGLQMIFDTGCSSTLISLAEANYLYQKGYLTLDDILGLSQSQIADGSVVENMVINLKEVIIDGKIKCTNVTATVSSNTNAPLLLGNEVLNRVASYSVDNENKLINFRLK